MFKVKFFRKHKRSLRTKSKSGAAYKYGLTTIYIATKTAVIPKNKNKAISIAVF